MIHYDRFRGYNPADIYKLIEAVSKLSWGLWITLTFSVRLTSDQAIVRGRRLMWNLRKKTPLRKWIMIVAPQTEGNPHVHLLVDAWYEPEQVRLMALLPMIAGDDPRCWILEKTPEVCVKVARAFHPRYMLEPMVFQPGQVEIEMSKPMSAALKVHLREGGAL